MTTRGPLAALALIVLVYLPFALLTKDYSRADPDRYFHLSLARSEAGAGLIHTIPQAEDIGWGRQYPEKELLFHVLGAIAWRIGGERAVLALPHVFSILTILLIFLCARLSLSFTPALFIALISIILSPQYFIRMTCLRAFTLAVPMFMLAVLGILKQSRKLVVLGCMLMAMSYHAFYITALPLVAGMLISFLNNRKVDRIYVAGLAGLSAGILLTPYFPANILMMWQNVMVAFGAATAKGALDYGSEVLPLSADAFLYRYGVHLTVFVLGMYLLGRNRLVGRGNDLGVKAVLATCGTLWCLAAIEPRAIEYSVPATAVVLASIAGVLDIRGRLILICSFVLGLTPMAIAYYNGGTHVRSLEQAAISAVDHFPPAAVDALPAQGKKVFNCSFFLSPYVLYRRPDLRFVDILDPSLIYRQNPAFFRLRDDLRAGSVADAWSMLRNVFHADYVLCTGPEVVSQFEDDPRFRRLFPVQAVPGDFTNPDQVFAYELAATQSVEFAHSFEVAPLPPSDATTYLGRKPLDARAAMHLDLGTDVYLNLTNHAGIGNPALISCQMVRPGMDEVRNHVGATFLGIGGGRNIRLWLNGRPLYSSVEAAPEPRVVTALIPLARPLVLRDRIEAIVCSGSQSAYMGFALSFWTQTDLKQNCEWKRALQQPSLEDWAYVGMRPRSCLAPYAVAVH